MLFTTRKRALGVKVAPTNPILFEYFCVPIPKLPNQFHLHVRTKSHELQIEIRSQSRSAGCEGLVMHMKYVHDCYVSEFVSPDENGSRIFHLENLLLIL